MQKLSQIAAKGDLEILRKDLLRDIKGWVIGQIPLKEFYSPKEFSHIIGAPYSTVLNWAKAGRIKARQDATGCSWFTHASEIERYKKEATEIDISG